MTLNEEQKIRANETRRKNTERREFKQKQLGEFCEILLELLKSDKIAENEKSTLAEIYAKAIHMIY